jgi:hypothetical protein
MKLGTQKTYRTLSPPADLMAVCALLAVGPQCAGAHGRKAQWGELYDAGWTAPRFRQLREKFQTDPDFKEYILLQEYFERDNRPWIGRLASDGLECPGRQQCN